VEVVEDGEVGLVRPALGFVEAEGVVVCGIELGVFKDDRIMEEGSREMYTCEYLNLNPT